MTRFPCVAGYACLLAGALSPSAALDLAATNLAFGKPVHGTTANLPNMVDGSYATSANAKTDWSFYVDLGAKTEIGRVILTWVDEYYEGNSLRYSVSDDTVNWKKIWEVTDANLRHGYLVRVAYPNELFLDTAVSARYFKVDLMNAATANGIYASELELYAPNTSTHNLALGKPATSKGSSATVNTLNDDDWWTYLDPQGWYIINLQQPTEVNRIRVIGWHHKIITSYNMLYSTDSLTWKPLYQVTNGTTQEVYAAYTFPTVTAKYIKCEATGNLGDIYVYGPGSASSAVHSHLAKSSSSAQTDSYQMSLGGYGTPKSRLFDLRGRLLQGKVRPPSSREISEPILTPLQP